MDEGITVYKFYVTVTMIFMLQVLWPALPLIPSGSWRRDFSWTTPETGIGWRQPSVSRGFTEL